jgi:hypothetical protein
MDDEGRALSGVPVQAFFKNPEHVSRCQTGSDGLFRLGVPPGAELLKVVAGAPHQAVSKINVAPGSEELEFVLSKS